MDPVDERELFRREGGEDRGDLVRRPLLPGHDALAVDLVAPVEGHGDPPLKRQAGPDLGNEHLAGEAALVHERLEDGVHRQRGGVAAGGFVALGLVLVLHQRPPHHPALVGQALHLLDHAGERAVRSQVAPDVMAGAGRHRVALALHREGLVGALLDAIHDGVAGRPEVAVLLRREQAVLQPPQVGDVLHRVHEPAHFVHGEVAVALAVGFVDQVLVDHGLQAARLHRLDPRLQRLALVDVLEALAGAQIEPLQEGVDLIAVVGVQALAGGHALEPLQEAHGLLDFGLGVVGRLGRVAVDHLVAELGRRRDHVALGHGLGRQPPRAGLRTGELAGPQVADRGASDQIAGEVAGGLGQHLALADRLGRHVGLGGVEAQPGGVVDRLIGGGGDGLRVLQIAIALHHPLVGATVDLLLHRGGVEQGFCQLVARGEAEQLGGGVRVQAALGQHPIFPEAQLAPVLKLGGGAVVDVGDRVLVQLVRALVLGAVRRDAPAQEALGRVDGLGIDFGLHLGAHGLLLLAGLTLQVPDHPGLGVAHPGHVAHGPAGQGVLGVRRGVRTEALVGLPLLIGDTLRARVEGGGEGPRGLGPVDLLLGGQEAVEHAPDFGADLDVELGDRLVDVGEPGFEPLERALEGLARGLAFAKVGDAARVIVNCGA